jgi:RNA polymerase sigma-70 factor (ECF subfamily)
LPDPRTPSTNPAPPWTPWLNQHGPTLVLLARQWASDAPTADDIVQEGFLRFWRSREKAIDPVAYLYACVKRSGLEWQRNLRRRVRREEAAARPEAQPLFATNLEMHERQLMVESAMTHLPESQREVLVMKIWGKLTFPQIAEALDISPDTAASRYRYALSKLRELLSEERCS